MNSSTTIRSLPDPKLEWEEERFLLYLIEALISDETHTFGWIRDVGADPETV